jgi:hypothetical protein
MEPKCQEALYKLKENTTRQLNYLYPLYSVNNSPSNDLHVPRDMRKKKVRVACKFLLFVLDNKSYQIIKNIVRCNSVIILKHRLKFQNNY